MHEMGSWECLRGLRGDSADTILENACVCIDHDVSLAIFEQTSAQNIGVIMIIW